jgi:membrane protein implicated in regulation of membrane protease activity
MSQGNPRLLILMTFATALVLGGIIALATGSWWALVIPVVLHLVGTTIVISGVFKRLDQGDKPDPVTEARLEEERVQGAR